MLHIYKECPRIENERFLLRLVEEKDAKDLLRVYADKRMLPYFNSDNCYGDIFYYPTEERMLQAIRFWLKEYAEEKYVRFSIIDKAEKAVIGTFELFNRQSEDYFTDCGLLRLDVSHDYENVNDIAEIIKLVEQHAFTLFQCSMIATKARDYAVDRIEALKQCGYVLSEEMLKGHYKNYDSYWVKKTPVLTLL